MRVAVGVVVASRAVAVVRVAVDDFRLRRGAAAIDRGAVGDFELDGGVIDAEVVAQLMIDALQQSFAFTEVHLDNLHVAGEGMGLRAEAPDMKVVNIDDAGNLFHGSANVREVEIAGRAFEEDVQGLADDADGTPEDHRGDDEREQRIDPLQAGEQNAKAAEDDGGGGERVAKHVQEDAADVDVAGKLPEQGGDGAVHQHTGSGDVHHQTRLDDDRVGETMDGGDGDPAGEDDESQCVDEGGQHTGALIAERFVGGGGAGLQVDGDKAEAEGEEVGEVVAGFGEQRKRVGAETEPRRREDIEQRQAEGKFEDALDAGLRRVGFRVDVHISSVSVCGNSG